MGSGAAKQRALRRKSGKAASATSQATSQGSLPANAPSFDPAFRGELLQGWQSYSNKPRPFSLNQEARNTHRSAWSESTRLRDNAVPFVSGGHLSQDSPDKDEDEEDVSIEQLESAFEQRGEVSPSRQNETKQQTHIQLGDEPIAIRSTEADFFLTERVEHMKLSTVTCKSPLTQRRALSASSTSSGEVILFAGRRNPQKKRKQSPSSSVIPPHAALSPVPMHMGKSSSPKQPPAPANAGSRLKPSAKEFIPVQATKTASGYPPTSQSVPASGGWEENLNGSAKREDKRSSNSHSRRGRRALVDEYDDEEETLQDYIENVKKNQGSKEEASPNKSEQRRDHSESGMEEGEVRVVASTSQVRVPSTGRDNDWSSDDLRDFDELDTSDDELSDVGGVFSRRERPSGLQYLVSPRGQSTDFAKWILDEKLTSVRVKELILAFEETHPGGPDGGDEDEFGEGRNQWDDQSDENTEDEVLRDVIRDLASEHDENERILDHTSRMTDAGLARMLNKQAELGISTDDVILFDGAFEHDEDFIPFPTTTNVSNRTRTRRKRRSRGTFPSAEAFADILDEEPYDGFDIMDFDRPSLKPKRKGRKSANRLPFEPEDEELADQLARSWANDRAKKAIKKAEREELRQAGLLGPRAGKGRVDSQSRYQKNSMDMEQIKGEVRAFLLDGDRQALALSPMGSGQRAQVHVLAKALYLRSHSQGRGDTRFPILTKTDFTGRYDEDNISQIDALLAQRKFSTQWGMRRDKVAAATGAAGGKVRRSGGGGVTAGAGYMDGDVVGASAPELGSENRGRAMLERMGWSSGMGIGKAGNKGSLEVIKHVVKKSKAGLG